MDSFNIGISGLQASMRGLEVVGNNMANASTEGFHRQRLELVPAYSGRVGDLLLGGGVDAAGVRRIIDRLVEVDIARQQGLYEQVSQELSTLRTVESAFGELADEGTLGAMIDEFFNALHDLSTHPTNGIYQNQVVNAGDQLASRFRTLGEFLGKLEEQVVREAYNTVDEINLLLNQIADLNSKIKSRELVGGEANNLRDERDQRVLELSRLIGVSTTQRPYGVVDVAVSAYPLVTEDCVMELDVRQLSGGVLAVSPAGADMFDTEVAGGKLGGLFDLKNELLEDIHNELDDLARGIMEQINTLHTQGIGSAGSFTRLEGRQMPTDVIADLEPPVVDGNIYIRVIDQATGTVTREVIPVNAGADTLSDIADYVTNNITGLTASADLRRLTIQAQGGYEFDFLPAVLPEPTSSTLTGTSSPTISGIYSGEANDTWTCTVVGDGEVGNDDSLQVEVRDGGGQLLKTVNVGTGYVVGERLEIAEGVEITFSAGTLNNGEDFTFEVLADTDTSGLLRTTGLNGFFFGTEAVNMKLCPDIAANIERVATALGSDGTDNANILRMAELREEAFGSLDGLNPGEFYRKLVTQLGQDLTMRKLQENNIDTVLQNLSNQRDEISGVDINEQAAEMLTYERMFQSMGKYLNTARSYYETLFSLL